MPFKFLLLQRSFFSEQPTLIDIELEPDCSISVCGDTHGQYYDLLNLFSINGNPSETNPYVFNGDFVDRGSWSTEVLLTLLCFKLLYPQHMFLSRGNHETTAMNIYGFEGEMKAKYSQQHCDLSRELFGTLPLVHVIGGKVFCVHGGISTQPNFTLKAIKNINRFMEPPEGSLMSELLWSDPQVLPGRSPSNRGVGWSFGPDITNKFLEENNLDLIIRSHEVRNPGYQWEHGGKLITVFSAPNYCDQVGNEGAWVTVTRDGSSSKYTAKCTSFKHVPHPTVPPMAYASGLFGF